jgi:hypothetical protein
MSRSVSPAQAHVLSARWPRAGRLVGERLGSGTLRQRQALAGLVPHVTNGVSAEPSSATSVSNSASSSLRS